MILEFAYLGCYETIQHQWIESLMGHSKDSGEAFPRAEINLWLFICAKLSHPNRVGQDLIEIPVTNNWRSVGIQYTSFSSLLPFWNFRPPTSSFGQLSNDQETFSSDEHPTRTDWRDLLQCKTQTSTSLAMTESPAWLNWLNLHISS